MLQMISTSKLCMNVLNINVDTWTSSAQQQKFPPIMRLISHAWILLFANSIRRNLKDSSEGKNRTKLKYSTFCSSERGELLGLCRWSSWPSSLLHGKIEKLTRQRNPERVSFKRFVRKMTRSRNFLLFMRDRVICKGRKRGKLRDHVICAEGKFCSVSKFLLFSVVSLSSFHFHFQRLNNRLGFAFPTFRLFQLGGFYHRVQFV